MSRTRPNVASRRRRKRILKRAKGYYGARSKQIRSAIPAVLRAGAYAYRDRRMKKREFRRLWILRISAAVRSRGMNYSTFMRGLKVSEIELDRRVLSTMAIEQPDVFDKLVETAKNATQKAA